MNSIVVRRFQSLNFLRHMAVAKIQPVGLDVVECEYRSNQWCASLPLEGICPTDLELSVNRNESTIEVKVAENSNFARVGAAKNIRLPIDAKLDSVQARVVDEQLVICVDLADEIYDESLRVPIQGL